ncbi:MAG: hypothetical protein MJ248_06160 [Bacilli bacterium]|nr:hypothetical protein [Bacilli bacterium]
MNKLNSLVAILSILTLASCNKKSPTNEDTTHTHNYNSAGICECGDTLSKELTKDELYGDVDTELNVINGKVYFNFTLECSTHFYLNEYLYSTVDGSQNELFRAIELYKDGAFSNNWFAFHDYTYGLDIGVEGKKEYALYSEDDLEHDAKYYFAATVNGNYKAITIFINSYREHGNSEIPWVVEEENNRRTATYSCSKCGKSLESTEYFINEGTLPEIKLQSGKTLEENFDTLSKLTSTYSSRLEFYYAEYNNIYQDENTIVEASKEYTLYFIFHAAKGYCLPPSFVIKDQQGASVQILNIADNWKSASAKIKVTSANA